ncbi:MAG TPA: NAD-dependent epimerase/dehydratase family protein [Candidatus Binatia bacterium]|nr:NAD-dependent epimerase/dehydratase family protein [Candidatus Binatia bacterium]
MSGSSARTALVTGGCGFIGRHLTRLLAVRGYQVRVLDLQDWPEAPAGVEIRIGSILDPAALASALEGMQLVFHLAANPNLWAPDPRTFHAVNYEGTCRVLEAAAKAGVSRIVYTSTESILKNIRARDGSDAALIDENVELGLDDVWGAYCRSKYLAETAARGAAKSGLPVVIVNPTMPVGPGDGLLTPPTRMLLGFLNGATPAYLDCEFNLVDARDVALGHLLAAERGRFGERYILGGENLALGHVLELLREMTGLPIARCQVPYRLAYIVGVISEGLARLTKRPPLAPLTGVVLARSSMAFDSRKARRELGWVSRPLRQSLQDAVIDLQSRGLLRRDFTPQLA